jgi:hypothetical protein
LGRSRMISAKDAFLKIRHSRPTPVTKDGIRN